MADCPRLKIDGKAAVAFLCGAGALCFASIPLLSWLTKPLSAVGLIIGFFGCWLPARRQRADLWLPGAIVGLSALVLIFGGDWPRPAPAPPAPLAAISLDPEVADRQPIEESHWTDASTHAVILNDLRVQIMSARLETVELNKQGAQTVTPDHYLVIHLHVTFEGVLFKHFPYDQWAESASGPSKHPPALIDDRDHSYNQESFGPGWSVASSRAGPAYVSPGRSVDEILVFPAPPATTAYLQLTLPAAAFGQAGDFKFQIPRSMMESAK